MIDFYDKTWPELKAIIDSNPIFYTYEIIHMVGAGTFHYELRAIRHLDCCVYQCEIPKVLPINPPLDPPVDIRGDDQKDFEDNYMSRAGDWQYYQRSWEFPGIEAGVTNEITFQIVNPSNNPVVSILYAGGASIIGAEFGDTIKCQLRHPTLGIIGEIANITLSGEPIEKILLQPPLGVDGTPKGIKVPNGLYIQIKYDSKGTIAPKVIVSLEYKWA